MPDHPEQFDGLGRIDIIRREIAQGRAKSWDDLNQLTAREFLTNTAYAWSWAACALLDGHPRYRDRFRELGRQTAADEFFPIARRLFAADSRDIRTEWVLFTHQLQPGYDLERGAIDFKPGKPLQPGDAGSSHSVDVRADRGWQSSGILVEEGHRYEMSAAGEVTLAKTPKPWISQPQGISVVYSEGRPIGTLLAAIRQEPAVDGERERGKGHGREEEKMLKEIVVGPKRAFVAETTGTLYFRINDRWGSLADNEGQYRVIVRRAEGPRP